MADDRSPLIALLCGVRGSTPAPGEAFHRTGGHTSCVALSRGNGRLLVLDAGTGFRRLADELGSRPLRGSILLTHLHWDHVIGLPFLRNADRDDAEVDLYLPDQGTGDATAVLSQLMGPPFFPIDPTMLRGTWQRLLLDEGVRVIEGFRVTSAEISHKGGRTFGYRIVADGRSIAYLPDHAPATADGPLLAGALRLADGVDVLIHDAQFADHERAIADAFGHATIGDAMAFADRSDVGELVLFHHAPDRTDEQVEVLAPARTPGGRPIRTAREGDHIEIASRGGRRAPDARRHDPAATRAAGAPSHTNGEALHAGLGAAVPRTQEGP